jgi:transposase
MHDQEGFRAYLAGLPPLSPIAVESTGSWYWLFDEMERAGHIPILTHPARAKLMMGHTNKTDKLDAEGLAILLRNGTLPSVWVPPPELRDQRELPRMRLEMVHYRTSLKNRIHATFAKYNIGFNECSDAFSNKGRQLMETRIEALPPETGRAVRQELELLDQVERQIDQAERRIREVVNQTPEMKLLMTMPGVGCILAIIIALEIGSIDRFAGPEKLASYAGTVPRVNSSGGKTRYGKVRGDVNRYLKWAFIEAANAVMVSQAKHPERFTVKLYQRLREKKGHGRAIVAVAHHLAESAYWILKKQTPYLDPGQQNQGVSV